MNDNDESGRTSHLPRWGIFEIGRWSVNTMSYCGAERMEVTRQVQHLEKSLTALEKQGASPEEIEIVRDRLVAAMARLAAIGDCGD
jgi:hypothetical protein